MKPRAILAFLTAVLVVANVYSTAPAALAADPAFKINTVITDDEFTDFSWPAEKIQAFLDTKPGILKTYVAPDGRTAATIIWQAAQNYRINPKVILATIQKESSMISRECFLPDCSSAKNTAQYYLDWVVFYGWCDSCSTGSNKGFANQINAAAGAFRRYLDNIAASGLSPIWGPAYSKSIECLSSDYNNGRELCTPGTKIIITPGNAATAALYTYTPHPGGNYAFWYWWNNFGFNLRRFYPDGSLLRAQGDPNIYLVEKGVLRRFTNSGAFLSRYSFNHVISVPKDHLLVYDIGRSIAFANYSLLKSPQGGIYLIVDETKRPITSQAAFRAAGWHREELVKASWDDLNQYQDGQPITPDNIYPSGQLLLNKKNGSIWFVQDGIRHGIASKDILRSQFGQRKAIPVKAEQLETYTEGALIGFKDGELITSKTDGGTAYVISNGQRLPIASPQAFEAYHFNWKNLIRTDNRSMGVHPIGAVLDVDSMVRVASQ